MKRFSLLLLLHLVFQQTIFAQYWQQQTNYIIDVTLNEKDKTLDGFEKLTYTNNSPDTLSYIWFHIYPNAYKTDETAYTTQALQNGSTAFYFSNKEQRGYINRLDFKVDGTSARLEDHPEHIDIVKLVLPKALPPAQQVIITTPFHVKLPFIFSRSGYNKELFQVTQWYPKPAVYDNKGWHPMPYLEIGEFYSEFGNFDVRINVPQNYIVAASGDLQDSDEKNRLISNSAANSSEGNKTLNYKLENAHDFAWFASKSFIVNYDTCRLNNKVVDVFSFYNEKHKEEWSNSVQYAKDALRTRSNWIGTYPYNTLSVVQGAENGGGMEYPTITVISPLPNKFLLDEVIGHEIGHNWFYGILASNERQYPWLDEGLNSYYDERYMQLKYGNDAGQKIFGINVSSSQLSDIFLHTKIKQKRAQAINTTSEEFSPINYNLIAYHKTAQWLKSLEQQLGTESFDKAMQAYYQNWKFKHPSPQDFKKSIEQSTGKDLDAHFALLDATGAINDSAAKGIQFATPISRQSMSNYFQIPSKNILFLSPAAGFNSYDKFMIGAIISNYKLPPNNLQFLMAPLYATGSKKFNGLAKINYSVYSNNIIQKAEVFVNAAKFSMNDFTDAEGDKTITQFQKIAPGIKLTFKEKSARSTTSKYIQWKTFLIKEDEFRFSTDSIFNGSDTIIVDNITTERESRMLNQLQFVYENSRALYPFHLSVQVEQNKDFVRPTLTANYFFNYASGEGLQLRFFAGKFIYLNEATLSKQFETDRYHLNMTGANGYEDYTYSNYFVGRNKFEGIGSQQIMIRDGGFKIRTDLLAQKVGRSDDWLMAVNLNTPFPKKFNPLSVLPIKIPLRIFADVGTYAAAWEKNADTDRFLFDAGFHIPLFNETINFYFPIIYSSVYSDYVKSVIPKNRLLKTMSFTINFNNKMVQKIKSELQF